MFAQEALSLTLRQTDGKPIATHQVAKADVPDLATLVVDRDSVQLMASLQHLLAHPHHLEHFKGSRKDCQGPGSRRRCIRFIDDSASHTTAGEFAGHRQADGTGANHENIIRRVKTHESFGTRFSVSCDVETR